MSTAMLRRPVDSHFSSMASYTLTPSRDGIVTNCETILTAVGAVPIAQPSAVLHYGSLVSHSNSTQTSPKSEKWLGHGAFGVVWSSTDPRDGAKVVLKRIPRVFQNSVMAKRAFREVKILIHIRHENIVSLVDIVEPETYDTFNEMCLLCEPMQSDLHRIIVSSQPLTADHVGIFIYQLLRGLKYLHSARIIHRDIKPGNLLVNANCLLKICDFGLARVEDPETSTLLTQEVVTQYYRAPEILMGCHRYSYAIDMWSVGCILSELLLRRILFQAHNVIRQLELMVELLGPPPPSLIKQCSSSVPAYILKKASRRHSNGSQTVSPNRLSNHFHYCSSATKETVHLLSQLLVFDPDKRLTASEALRHAAMETSRMRYHFSMCECCEPDPQTRLRQCTPDPEPICRDPLPTNFDSDLDTTSKAKSKLWLLIHDYFRTHNRPVRVRLNRNGANYKAFMGSQVAQASQIPSSPKGWE